VELDFRGKITRKSGASKISNGHQEPPDFGEVAEGKRTLGARKAELKEEAVLVGYPGREKDFAARGKKKEQERTRDQKKKLKGGKGGQVEKFQDLCKRRRCDVRRGVIVL